MPIGQVAEFPFQNSSDGSAAAVPTDEIVILADHGGLAIGSGQLFSASIDRYASMRKSSRASRGLSRSRC